MTRLVPGTLLLVAALASRADAQSMSCDDCAHLCVWAHQIESASKLRQLYADAFGASISLDGDAAGWSSTAELERTINLAMLKWNQSKDAESPCYKQLLAEFTSNPDMTEPPSPEAETTNPLPTGSVLRTDPFTCKVEDPKDVKARVCPQLYQALLDHEAVHQKVCESIHQDMTKAGYSPARQKAAIQRIYSDPGFRGLEEAAAYAAQLKSMKEKMAKVLESGCNIKKKSIKDFLAKPGPKPNLPDIYKALKLLDEYNAPHKPKPKIIDVGGQ